MATQFTTPPIGPSGRTIVDLAEVEAAGSPVMLDGLRRRPRYFDGKFLTGGDLTRDQDYIRQRQNDLAAATGIGVVRGLHAAIVNDGTGTDITIEDRPWRDAFGQHRDDFAKPRCAAARYSRNAPARCDNGAFQPSQRSFGQPFRPVHTGASACRVHFHADQRLPQKHRRRTAGGAWRYHRGDSDYPYRLSRG